MILDYDIETRNLAHAVVKIEDGRKYILFRPGVVEPDAGMLNPEFHPATKVSWAAPCSKDELRFVKNMQYPKACCWSDDFIKVRDAVRAGLVTPIFLTSAKLYSNLSLCIKLMNKGEREAIEDSLVFQAHNLDAPIPLGISQAPVFSLLQSGSVFPSLVWTSRWLLAKDALQASDYPHVLDWDARCASLRQTWSEMDMENLHAETCKGFSANRDIYISNAGMFVSGFIRKTGAGAVVVMPEELYDSDTVSRLEELRKNDSKKRSCQERSVFSFVEGHCLVSLKKTNLPRVIAKPGKATGRLHSREIVLAVKLEGAEEKLVYCSAFDLIRFLGLWLASKEGDGVVLPWKEGGHEEFMLLKCGGDFRDPSCLERRSYLASFGSSDRKPTQTVKRLLDNVIGSRLASRRRRTPMEKGTPLPWFVGLDGSNPCVKLHVDLGVSESLLKKLLTSGKSFESGVDEKFIASILAYLKPLDYLIAHPEERKKCMPPRILEAFERLFCQDSES